MSSLFYAISLYYFHRPYGFNKHSNYRKIVYSRITCYTLLPCPLHTSLPAHFALFPLLVSYIPSYTLLRLTPHLHAHLLCTSRDKSATRETADPAADSRPIPSLFQANTRCSSESRGPSSRIVRHSPNSAHETRAHSQSDFPTFLARTRRKRPRR